MFARRSQPLQKRLREVGLHHVRLRALRGAGERGLWMTLSNTTISDAMLKDSRDNSMADTPPGNAEPRLRISNSLSLPIDAVTQRFAWMGRTGSGKSYGAQKLAELMLEAGAQIVVFDIPGQWYGLRLGPKPFAIPVFGGAHGDIPLEPAGGAAVADLVVARGISVVLDVSQMDDEELWSFTADFNERFFVLKQSAPSPVHVYYDECHELVPQEWERAQKRCFRSVNRQQKRGRVLGIGVSLISQRPQEVSKKVLDQAECVFAFQMRSSLERESIANGAAATGSDKKMILQTLATLPVGSAQVFSPQWLGVSETVKIAKKPSPDVSATPKLGDRKEAPKTLSPVDLQDLRISMEAAIARAREDDPRELRKRITELENQLRRGRKSVLPPAPEPKRVEVPVLSESALCALQQLLAANDTLSAELRAALDRFAPASFAPAPQAEHEPPQHRNSSKAGAKAPVFATRSRTHADREVGSGGLQRILVALAQRPQGLSTRQIGVRAGLSARSGTFSTYLSRARREGWIAGRAQQIQITEAGRAALGHYEPLPTGRALLDYWVAQLGQGGITRLLNAVWSAHPRPLSLVDAASRAGLAAGSGTFSTYVSRLRALELVHGRGELRASDELFD